MTEAQGRSEVRKVVTLIVDAHVSIGEMLSMILNREGHFHLADEATSGLRGLRLFKKYKPDLVVLELDLPEMNGAEMLQEMREINPDVKALIYSGTSNQLLIGAGLDAEPQGFVHKSESLPVLLQAIRTVGLQEGTFFSPFATKQLTRKRSESQVGRKLTPKERSVLQLIAEGNTSKEVANHLAISPKTVEHYRKHVMQKLGLSSVAALTLYAVRYGLVNVALFAISTFSDMDWVTSC